MIIDLKFGRNALSYHIQVQLELNTYINNSLISKGIVLGCIDKGIYYQDNINDCLSFSIFFVEEFFPQLHFHHFGAEGVISPEYAIDKLDYHHFIALPLMEELIKETTFPMSLLEDFIKGEYLRGI